MSNAIPIFQIHLEACYHDNVNLMEMKIKEKDVDIFNKRTSKIMDNISIKDTEKDSEHKDREHSVTRCRELV